MNCERGGTNRFIPACAGNSVPGDDWGAGCAVHPRVCGEQTSQNSRNLAPDGSSPRVRGTVPAQALAHPADRFIPACAGNRRSPRRLHPMHSVHPRVCGEQIVGETTEIPVRGSSPRVRGTAGHRRGLGNRNRFIPACAGNSHGLHLHSSIPSVHPRVCGEQPATGGGIPPIYGSSPRVRGTAPPRRPRRGRRRFIPACAGNRRAIQTLSWIPSVHPRVCGEQARFLSD